MSSLKSIGEFDNDINELKLKQINESLIKLNNKMSNSMTTYKQINETLSPKRKTQTSPSDSSRCNNINNRKKH